MGKNGFGKFALGAAIGAGLGLLFAPKSGEENRKELKAKLDELLEQLKGVKAEDVKDYFEMKVAEIKKDLAELDKEKILEVAKENASNLNCNVTFLQSDMWDNVNDKYDVIISNPPYIRNDEEIEDVVRDNEPHLALYGGVDGLDLYRKIRKDLLNHVNDRFLVAFEIGDQQKDDVKRLFSDIPNTQIITKKDLSNRDRMVFIIK